MKSEGKFGGIKFKKSLGQNFIFDIPFLEAAIRPLNIQSNETIVEVGVGAGTLTRCLAGRAGRVVAYEIDETLRPQIEGNLCGFNNVQVIYKDILKVGEVPVEGAFRLVANIPYYITTPIIMKFLGMPACREICVLVQSDVAERICARPGGKEYGALTVSIQACAEARILRQVPRAIFRPVPSVDSAFVLIRKDDCHGTSRQDGSRLVAKTETKSPLPGFDTFIKRIFAARRKTIQNASGLPVATLALAGIAPTLRPEQIAPEVFVKLFALSTQSSTK